MNKVPTLLIDAYKASHHKQYPEDITWVYSNFTPRKGRDPKDEGVVFFGLQAFLKKLNELFEKDFFNKPKTDAVWEFATFYKEFFGADDELLYQRIGELHDCQCLPICVKALDEGTFVPYGIPMLTIHNTSPKFFWLTNYLETLISCEMWGPCTSATTALKYKKMFLKYARETGVDPFFCNFQGHDFSFRGMNGVDSAMASGAAHLTAFMGTDTLPAVTWIDHYYGWGDNTAIKGTSVPATEHSVMCAGGETSEEDTFSRLLDIYPTGILSVVSDTWDFWGVVTEILPKLKDKIMARDGKLVIRPDSSPKTPYEIICGDPEAPVGSPEYKGLILCLLEIFGGTENAEGYTELDPHIGAIYGDSITPELAEKILEKLKRLGYASNNIVFGIGSYTYQHVTRDTHGFAMKATAIGRGTDWKVMGDGHTWFPPEITPIFKDPKTDNSGKKSACGLLTVMRDTEGVIRLIQGSNPMTTGTSMLKTVYLDGIIVEEFFSSIRNRIQEHIDGRLSKETVQEAV